MRSFILVPACLQGLATASEEMSSLMQKRVLKHLDTHQNEHPEFFDKLGDAVVKVMDTLSGGMEMPAYRDPHTCGEWGAWGECSVPCGGGLKTRQYTFLDGVKCGKECAHGNGDLQQKECNMKACPVDCEGSWSEYGSCSASCDGGVQTRMFRVTQEALHGGKECPVAGGAMEDHACSEEKCETHCKGHFEDWGECSNGGAGPKGMECGPGGSQSRGFTVTVDHTDGGCGCTDVMWGATEYVSVDAETVDTRSCELPCCPETCEGEWSDWGECQGASSYEIEGPYGESMCCGGGMKSKTFSVTKEKVCGGQCCEAATGAVDTATCCETPCPVDCEGDWGPESECSTDCGGGQTEAVFMVTQEALHGGRECPHKPGAIKHTACNEHPCPIPCEGHWDEWDECTEECGPNGTQSRHWIITVEAEHGGKKCSEKDQVQVQSCDPEPVPCPIDAVCKWGNYSECDACCSDGVTPIMKYRKWEEVSPAKHGGAECINTPTYGESEEAVCQKPRCPIDCEGDWSEYDTCNANIANPGGHFCGKGTKTKVWQVSVPSQFGGAQCPHEDGHKESKLCGDTPCPVNCTGAFTEWGHCCSSCGGGSQSRDYVISEAAKHGGVECPHNNHTEHQVCNKDPCPVPCEGSWGEWGDCNQECTDCRANGEKGKSMRSFTVSQEAQHGGPECAHKHDEVEEKTCNEVCCPQNCEGEWSEFSACSSSCGGGNTERTYKVTHEAAYGGEKCPYCDHASHEKACDGLSPCSVDCSGDFTEWSSCTERCGGGEQTAWFIQNVMAENGGEECEHGQFEQVTRPCNTEECPQRCLGAFGPWGACDSPCSGGVKSRKFMVLRPAAGGGPECSHANGDVDTASCHDHPCPEGFVCPPTKTCTMSNGLIQVR